MDDELLGSALCVDCYDYESAVLFNASVSELWRRTTIYTLRALGNLAGFSVRSVAKVVRLSYVKVVEFQRRGSVHLHAIVRIDAVSDELIAPSEHFNAEMLAMALQYSAMRVSAPVTSSDIPDGRRIRWGKEIDIAVVNDDEKHRARSAAYLAKYSTKSTEDRGLLDRQLRAGLPESLELPSHLRRLVETAWYLGGEPGTRALRLRAWAHTAGYRGHFLTKSRRFSTTFDALRTARQEWQIAKKHEQLVGLFDDNNSSGDNGASFIKKWTFLGMGYTTAGDSWLAESIAEDKRFARICAYEQRMYEQEEAA